MKKLEIAIIAVILSSLLGILAVLGVINDPSYTEVIKFSAETAMIPGMIVAGVSIFIEEMKKKEAVAFVIVTEILTIAEAVIFLSILGWVK